MGNLSHVSPQEVQIWSTSRRVRIYEFKIKEPRNGPEFSLLKIVENLACHSIFKVGKRTLLSIDLGESQESHFLLKLP